MNPLNADFSEKTLEDLVDYIVDKHHAYSRQMLKQIESKLQHLSDNESYDQKKMKDLHGAFLLMKDDMERHMRKEEFILFPFIKKMVFIRSGKISGADLQIGLVENPIRILQKEHTTLTGLLSKIRTITHDFTPAQGSQPLLKHCYGELFAFEQDLHNHIYLENNILFPKVLDLEKQLKERKVTLN